MESQVAAAAGQGEAGLAGEQQAQRQRLNRRQFPRYAVDCAARVTLLSGAAVIDGRISDLSLGGCRVVAPEPVSVGILARAEICFELRGCLFRIVGVTAGTRAKKSFGLRFLEMPARRVEALAELLEEIRRHPQEPEAAARPSLPPPIVPAHAAKPQPAARQQAAERQTAADEIIAPAGHAPGTQPTARPPERRDHQRHGVDTRVNLTLIRGAITMTGQILNLSQGGCRLRTDEPFTVGIYTRVEAEFFLHGLPFRLAGVSQTVLDRKTIGIRFLDMSERKRAQLTELIAEIEQMQGERAGAG